MTISKKLLIIGALALGINQLGLAQCMHPLHYDMAPILNFAKTLHQTHNKDNVKLAQWLEQQVRTWKKSYKPLDHKYDLSMITQILDNDKLNIQSKISMLSQVMAEHKQRNSIIGTIRNCLGAAVGFTVAIITGKGGLL